MSRLLYALIVGIGFVAPLGAADGLRSLFDKQSHDFGNVPIGPLVQTSFTFKNTTNQNLHVAKCRVPSACTVPSTAAHIIAPLQPGVIPYSMDPRPHVLHI